MKAQRLYVIETLICFECFKNDEHINLTRYYFSMNFSFSVIFEASYFHFFFFAI